MNEKLEIPENAIAVVKYPNGKYRAICQTFQNGLYLSWLNYDGLFAYGATSDCTLYSMQTLSEDIKAKNVEIVYTRHTLYHCFHICFCDDCSRYGGRVYDHSQGSNDGHLRPVPADKIVTLPTVQ